MIDPCMVSVYPNSPALGARRVPVPCGRPVAWQGDPTLGKLDRSCDGHQHFLDNPRRLP